LHSFSLIYCHVLRPHLHSFPTRRSSDLEVFTYNPFRLRGKWSMDGKKIRLGSNFIHFHLLDLRFLGLIVGQIRVEGNDSHAEALRTFGYTEPDFTNTDDAKCLAVHFSPLVSFPVPCTCRKLFMCSGDVARE